MLYKRASNIFGHDNMFYASLPPNDEWLSRSESLKCHHLSSVCHYLLIGFKNCIQHSIEVARV